MKEFWERIKRYIDFKRRNIKVWEPSNVYLSARIGNNVSIGAFSEVGENVEIGEGTRIGAFCFIPEKVKIGKNVFISPRVTFTNDLYPPGKKEDWKETFICDNARIGAGVIILSGIVIGSYSLVGAGAVVTKSIEPYSRIIGIPGKKIASEKR